MQGEAFKRYQLTDMKDLSNISIALGLEEVQRSENDQESVWAWIQERQESVTATENNPVLFYRYKIHASMHIEHIYLFHIWLSLLI